MELISLPADLKQNIFYMAYFIVKHNFWAILFAFFSIVSIIMAIIKPSRFSICLFVGFLLLLFSFEYIKHIRDPLREQTINSLVTINPHNKVTRIVNFTLSKALPIFLPSLGTFLIVVAFVFFVSDKKRRNN